MKHSFFKATVYRVLGDSDFREGDTIHISVSRTQAFGKVKQGKYKGYTKFIMNTPKEIIYVMESPKDLEVEQKSIDFDE